MSLSMVFAQKAQAKTKMDPMLGLFTTIFVNNVITTIALIVRFLILPPEPVDLTGALFLAMGGVSGSVLGRGLIFVTISILGAARAGLTKATMPVFVLFGGVVILGERLGPMSWLGVCIVLLGLFLMSIDSARRSEKLQADRIRLLKGISAGLGAAFFFAASNVLRKPGISLLPDPILALFLGSFTALLACIAVLLIQGKGRAIFRAIKNIEINYAISGICSSAAIFTMLLSLRLIPVSIANSISAIEPLTTIFFVWLLKGVNKEKVGVHTVIFGIIMIIGAIILVFY